MAILAWTIENWFSLAQTLGIMGGFAIAARSLSLDERARRTEIYLQINESHRDIWENLVASPELAAVLDPDRDLASSPPNPAEERLVLLVLLHTAAVHRASTLEVFDLGSGMVADVRDFFRLPVPAFVLEKFRPYQEWEFLRFLDQLQGVD